MTYVIDLSHAIDSAIPMFPGLPAPDIEPFLSREASRAHYAGDTSFVLHRYSFIGNTATYLDSPYHRFADGLDVATLPLTATVDLPGVVIDVSERVKAGQLGVGATEIGTSAQTGVAVLVHTGWSERWGELSYLEANPHLTADGAELLAERGVSLLGIDSWNADDVADLTRPAHSVLLRAGIPIIENLNMQRIVGLPQTGFKFFAAPLLLRGGSSVPVRAFALVDGG